MSGSGVVVFDLDGTLTDSQAGIVDSYVHTLRSLGLDADPAAIRPWIGPPLVQGLAALGVAPALLDEAVATYRKEFASAGIYRNELYPGVAEMLAALAGAGFRLAVATSKLEEFARTIVDHFGLATYFSTVAGATRDGTRITKGAVLAHALTELGRPDPAVVAMAGDRRHDMVAAVEHGVHPVGVLWGYGSRAELVQSGAEILAATPVELARLVIESSAAWTRTADP